MSEPWIHLTAWHGPWSDDDRDANLKADVDLYTRLDPLETITNLSRNTGIPVGALVRYVLARWASAGSESLLYVGPSVLDRMWRAVTEAEGTGTTEARLSAYETIRQMISWLRAPLDES